jgi:hypothetical protein
MKKLLFGGVITMIVVSPAFGGLGLDQGDSCKACPSWRSPASSDPPPPSLLPKIPVPGCHLVKERVGTRRNGHAVYQTRQVC